MWQVNIHRHQRSEIFGCKELFERVWDRNWCAFDQVYAVDFLCTHVMKIDDNTLMRVNIPVNLNNHP